MADRIAYRVVCSACRKWHWEWRAKVDMWSDKLSHGMAVELETDNGRSIDYGCNCGCPQSAEPVFNSCDNPDCPRFGILVNRAILVDADLEQADANDV